MISVLFSILVLLQIKHWYIDFVNQSDIEVTHKGIYLDWLGMKHSVKHGLATFIIFWFFTWMEVSLIIGIIDFLFHYHIDYIKMRFGNRDVKTKEFWAQLGLDQLAHQLTYIGIALLLVI
jgi:type III secretory pathway component EscU